MEFLMDNIMWFIGGALVVVLAIIGFYAEKKNFGKSKNSNEKKEPINNEIKEEIVQSNTETKEEVAQSNVETKDEVVENAPLKTDDVIEENNINKDINDNQEVVSEEKEVIDNDIKIEEPSETEILSKVAKEEIISEEAIEEENKEEEIKEIKEEVVENQITDSVDEIGIKEEEELPVTIEETIDDVKNNSNSKNSGINEVSLEEIEEASIKKENEPEKVPEKKSLFGLNKKTKEEVVEEPTKEEIEEATKEDQGIPEDDDVWKF